MDFSSDDYRWRTTRGTGDFIFSEAEKRRDYAARCAEVFQSWGYSEVITPTIEYFQSLEAGLDPGVRDKLFRFFDQDGRMLALRPEMTTPVARVVGTRLKEYALPLRCYYIADVYRNEPPQASHRRQFLQAGIELIGASERLADAEVLAVVIECLQQLGLEDFRLDIGHIDFLKGILAEASLSPKLEAEVRKALREKNLVKLKSLTAAESSLNASLREVPYLIGGEDVLEQARDLVENERSRQALAALSETWELLKSDGLDDFVRFDLSMVKDFDYYTGLILEAYTDNLGFSLCTGGRYDNLIHSYGRDLPAVGFAMGLERLFWALKQNGVEDTGIEGREVWVFYTEDSECEVLPLAREIRALGCSPVIMGPDRERDGKKRREPLCRLTVKTGQDGLRVKIREVRSGARPETELDTEGIKGFLEGLL